MKSVIAFLRLSRLQFLVGGFLMFALGAFTQRPICLGHYVLGQIMVSFAQLTAHYTNEYADYEADMAIANRTSFSGGSGVLVSGVLSRVVALRAAQVTTVVTVAAAIWLASFNIPAAVMGVLALSISWAYSMPPVRLLNTGVGELATSFTVAMLVPLIGSYSQHHNVAAALIGMMAVLFLMQLAMLLAFELPDLVSDEQAGKRVLGVRLGPAKTLWLIAALVAGAAVVDGIGYSVTLLSARQAAGALLALPTALLMVPLFRARCYGLATFSAVASFFLCGVGFLCAVVA